MGKIGKFPKIWGENWEIPKDFGSKCGKSQRLGEKFEDNHKDLGKNGENPKDLGLKMRKIPKVWGKIGGNPKDLGEN